MHGYAPIVSVGDIALMDKAAGSVYVPVADQVGTIWDLADSSAAGPTYGTTPSVSADQSRNPCRTATASALSGTIPTALCIILLPDNSSPG